MREKIIDSIINTLQENPWGLTIEEISEKTGLHRNTVSKYMSILEEAGLAIKRRIGKYTIWFIRNIYYYFRTDMAERFLISLVSYLYKTLNIDLFKAGRIIVKRVLRKERFDKANLREVMRNKVGIFRYFTGVYIPTIVPGIKFRIHRIKLSDPFLIIEVSGRICEVDNEIREAICDFMRGYIWGLLEMHDLPFIDIIKIRTSDNACKFKILFNEPIVEIFLK